MVSEKNEFKDYTAVNYSPRNRRLNVLGRGLRMAPVGDESILA
jgi:hypothetical protein